MTQLPCSSLTPFHLPQILFSESLRLPPFPFSFASWPNCHALHFPFFIYHKRSQSDHTCHHPHRFSELATKKWNGRPRLACVSINIHLWKLQWMYCPGHAGGKGNDQADRLAGKATTTSGLRLGWCEVLRNLRHYLQPQSQGRHTTDRLGERGSVWHSSLKRQERAIVSRTNTGTVSKATLGKLTRHWVEDVIIMGFFEYINTILNWTEPVHEQSFQ